MKEKLAGRQRKANECNSKCIQGTAEEPLYSYQLIRAYQWRCTVVQPSALLPTSTSPASVLFNTGQAAVISPSGRLGPACGVKEISETTQSSHQNKSGQIKEAEKCPFFRGEGGRAIVVESCFQPGKIKEN